MLHNVQVKLDNRSYPIYIGEDILNRLGDLISELNLGNNCLVISDENTNHFYEHIVHELNNKNIANSLFVVPAGESSKSLEQVGSLHSKCIKSNLDRNSFIIALGGGVIGDLAGYVAASFLRGIPFVQVPTSLLAMVDSAVGGKTGVNLKEGKNLVGAFHQPSLVLSDLNTLNTLPIREIRAGMAEVVKYGIIYDANFFDKIEEQCIGTDLLASNEILAYNISRCCEIKAEVVAKDERESGLRAILNFGHTLGHAIENVTGYTNSFIHGEAISIGMVYAAKLSVRCNGFIDHDAQRIEKLLNNIGLPTNQNGLVWNDLKEAMLVDKKTVSGIPRFVLVSNIGKVTIGHQIEERILKEVWDSLNE